MIAGNKEAWYAHLIEYGTGSFYAGNGSKSKKRHTILNRRIRKAFSFAGLARQVVTHPGIQPKPFMRPAFDASNQQSIEAIANYIRIRLPKEIKKAGI